MIWGASANKRTYWRRDARESLGWAPQDSADPFAGQLGGKVSDSPIEERYQGGGLHHDGLHPQSAAAGQAVQAA